MLGREAGQAATNRPGPRGRVGSVAQTLRGGRGHGAVLWPESTDRRGAIRWILLLLWVLMLGIAVIEVCGSSSSSSASPRRVQRGFVAMRGVWWWR